MNTVQKVIFIFIYSIFRHLMNSYSFRKPSCHMMISSTLFRGIRTSPKWNPIPGVRRFPSQNEALPYNIIYSFGVRGIGGLPGWGIAGNQHRGGFDAKLLLQKSSLRCSFSISVCFPGLIRISWNKTHTSEFQII